MVDDTAQQCTVNEPSADVREAQQDVRDLVACLFISHACLDHVGPVQDIHP
jgi:mRNA degradation ribonuclease J1/J2